MSNRKTMSDYKRSGKGKIVWRPITATACGSRSNALWPYSTGGMRKSLSRYSAERRPYNRRRLNRVVKRWDLKMPSKAGRRNLCDVTYYLSTDKMGNSLASKYSLPKRYVPRKTYLRRAAPKPRKCKTGYYQCGSRCIKEGTGCRTLYSKVMKRYLTPEEYYL
jgi:hypothetical protein